MTYRLAWIGMIVALGLAAAAASARADTVPGGKYGAVRISEPAGAMRGFVVLFSALSGWNGADQQAADLLGKHGMLVVGVDTGRYAATLVATPEACHHLVGDAEAISHQLQREARSSRYFTPIVAGAGEGGTLAEQVLSTAASNTIGGAVSIDPAPALDARFNPCPPDPTILHDAGLPGFWSVGTTMDLAGPTQARAAQLQGSRRQRDCPRLRARHVGGHDTAGTE